MGTRPSGVFNDSVQIAGNLVLDNYVTTSALNTGQDAAVVINPDPTKTPNQQTLANYVTPSNDPNGFDTHTGEVRDGSNANDIDGQPRNVNRLEPPTLDSVNPATNLTRYRDITENASARTVNGTAIAPNPPGRRQLRPFTATARRSMWTTANDMQQESSSLVGGYTLIDEWLHRTDAGQSPGSKSGWVANFYRPPGVDIVLGRQISDYRHDDQDVLRRPPDPLGRGRRGQPDRLERSKRDAPYQRRRHRRQHDADDDDRFLRRHERQQ